jgi:hypothetical protein
MVLQQDPGEAEDHRDDRRQLDPEQGAEVGSGLAADGAEFIPDLGEPVIHSRLEAIHPRVEPVHARVEPIHAGLHSIHPLFVAQRAHGGIEAPSNRYFKRRYRRF